MPFDDPRPVEMPAPDRSDLQAAVLAPGASEERLGGTDIYLTDEVFLYRLAGPRSDEVIEVEDCYLLDRVEVPVDDLSARRLRVVTPASTRE